MLNNTDTSMKPNAASDTSPKPRGATDVTRRRLFKTGLAAAPTVLTLASRPVLAATCKTPSAYTSANLSHPQGIDVNGTFQISSWITSSRWPIPYVANPPNATKFSSLAVFDNSTKYGKVALNDANATMLDVLKGTTFPPSSPFDKNLVVTLLNITRVGAAANCLAGPAGLPAAQVQLNAMFRLGPLRMYQPIAGANTVWGTDDINTYLRNNGFLG